MLEAVGKDPAGVRRSIISVQRMRLIWSQMKFDL